MQWLHTTHHIATSRTRYKGGNTLVSVHFFLQDLLLNYPHRVLSQLFIPNYKDYPEQFRYFACAIVNRVSERGDMNAVKFHFKRHGHRDYYVNNLLSHIASLHNMINLWHKGVRNRHNFFENVYTMTRYKVDEHQMAIFHQNVRVMHDRNEHYSSIEEFGEISDEEEDPDLFVECSD